MTLKNHFIIPVWPVPESIKALVTTRKNSQGLSLAPYDNFNLAMHVGDNPSHVNINRKILANLLPAQPVWLNQIHSQRVIEITDSNNIYHNNSGDNNHENKIEDADGSFSTQRKQVCTVLTADCLPILISSQGGEVVSAVHAGWRGLAIGIINTTIELITSKTALSAGELIIWLGPAIGKQHFEVGAEVREQFIKINPENSWAFTRIGQNNIHKKYLADIYLLAKINLQKLGVTEIYGGNYCTYEEQDNFYSYRRDGITGRMASLIWKA